MSRQLTSLEPAVNRFVPPRRSSAVVARVSWAYLFSLLVFWEFLRLRGDRSWLGTVVLFGPVWITALPLAILVPVALRRNRRSLWVLLLSGLIALFPVMGFCLPWRALLQRPVAGQPLRMLTCNVHGSSLRVDALERLIAETRPDVVLLQECPTQYKPAFFKEGWNTRVDDELLIASRYPIAAATDYSQADWTDWGGAVTRYDLSTPAGLAPVFNVHLASPHLQFLGVLEGTPAADRLLERHLEVRRAQSEKVARLAEQLGGSAIIAGDFNSLAEGTIYRANWGHFADAFATAGFGLGHTYFGEGASVRIDHILAGASWRIRSCRVCSDVGSPHRPLLAELYPVRTEAR